MSEPLDAGQPRVASLPAFSLAGRSGWQLLVSYIVGSWIVLQVAETLDSLIGLPLWFGPTLLGLLIAGLLLLLLSLAVQAGRSVLPGGTSSDRRGIRQWLTVRNVAFAGLAGALLLALATAAYLLARAAGIGPVGTLIAKGVLEDQDRLILADFTSGTNDRGLGPTVTTLFQIDLAQSPSFTVLDAAQLGDVLQRMQRDPGEPLTEDVALEAARREGIKGIVTGDILTVGDALVVAARLVAASSGETLAAVRETARSASDLPRTVDRASARLRERIGESLRTIQGDNPLERVTTGSFAALELYVQADQANNASDTGRAIDLLEDAIEQDSTFAMAYRKLAIILRNEDQEPARADEAFTRAWELRDHLSQRESWLAEAAYLGYVQRDPGGAASVYTTLLERYPTDRIALNNLALIYGQTGRYPESLELLLRSIDTGAGLPVTYGNAIEVQFTLGQSEALDSMIERYRTDFPGNPQPERFEAAVASARFDYETAEVHLRRFHDAVSANPALQVATNAERAMAFLIRGQIAAARRALVDAAVIEERAGIQVMGLTPELAAARIDAMVALRYLDEPVRAGAIADAAFPPQQVAAWPADARPYSDLTIAYAQAGRLDRAREWLGRFEAERPADVREREYGWHVALGEVALGEGRYDDALREFRVAGALVDDCPICFVAEVGRTFDAAGQPDSAIDAFTRYLNERHLYRINLDADRLCQVLLRLAELHELEGQPREAMRYYTRLLDLWSNADPVLSGRVEAVRRAVNRLAERVG
jgi:tetratricopeptide (TPR) repeat protein